LVEKDTDMAGRRRTIDRKGQRTDPTEEETEKAEDEELDEDEDEEGDDEESDEDEEAVVADDEELPVADDDDDAGGDDDDEDAPKKKKKKVVKKKAAAPKRSRSVKKAVKQKAIWVIFDNSSKQIEVFPYNQRTNADKSLSERIKADEKKGFYLQMVKVPLEEPKEKEAKSK
jgi:hypothetical protein